MTAALKNLSETKCHLCQSCHDQVKWQLEPRYGYNRVYVHLQGMPESGFVEPELKRWLARRIQVVHNTFYFLDSTYLKLSQMKVSSNRPFCRALALNFPLSSSRHRPLAPIRPSTACCKTSRI